VDPEFTVRRGIKAKRGLLERQVFGHIQQVTSTAHGIAQI